MKKYYNYQSDLDQLRETFSFDFAALALIQTEIDSCVLRWQYVSGNANDRYKKIVLKSGKGIAGIVFKTGKPFLMENAGVLPSHDLYNYPILVFEQLKSLAAVPLFDQSRIAGVLLVGFRESDQLDDGLFQAFQTHLGPAFGLLSTKELEQNDQQINGVTG